jgi:hypothetical protein
MTAATIGSISELDSMFYLRRMSSLEEELHEEVDIHVTFHQS